MKRFLPAAVAVLLSCGCASLKPGQTDDGLAVRVSTIDRQAARREAIESVLPLFLDRPRPGASETLERLVFSRTGDYVGRERLKKRREPIVEILLDRLAPVLQKSDLVRPPGYLSGQEKVLIALGSPGLAPSAAEITVGDAMRLALFGADIMARDLRDPFDPATRDKERVTVLADTVTVPAAIRGGFDWIVTGSVSGTAGPDKDSDMSRAAARLDARFYEVHFSSTPLDLSIAETAVDVSTGAAYSRALEQAGQSTADKIKGLIAERRAGRTNVAFLMPGPKSPERIRTLLTLLRRVPGVDGATLYAWSGPYDSVDVWAFVHGLSPEDLVARILQKDEKFNVVGIDTERREVFIEPPMPGMQ